MLILGLLPIPAAFATPVTAEQVNLAVTGWLRSSCQPLQTSLGHGVCRVEAVDGADGTPIYYVVYLRPSGLVIVAADDEVEPIIAFTAEGHFDPSTSNPLGALVGQDLPGRVVHARSQPSSQRGRVLRGKWRSLASVAGADGGIQPAGASSVSDLRAAPLVQSRWNQTSVYGGYCYNYYTPNHYPSGCVATAMAQLMRYHQHPVAGIGVRSSFVFVNGKYQPISTRGGDGAGGPYDWSQMPLVPDAAITTSQRQAIGALCFDAGVAVSTSYTSSLSLAGSVGTWALTNLFGYGNAIRGLNGSQTIPLDQLRVMINPNLDAGNPVLLGISGPNGGHAVVCDGYGYASATLYHHLNMGWSGPQDAWYNLPTIDSSPAFTAIFECGYNIYPTGTGEIISGRVVDANGIPILGATVTAIRQGGGMHQSTTTASGIYALSRVPSGATFTISVEASGYAFAQKVVSTGTSVDYASTAGNLWGIDFTAEPVLPLPPSQPVPLDGQVDVPTDVTLAWNNGQAVPGEVYDVYFGADSLPAAPAAQGLAVATYSPFGLRAGTRYYWRVVARNSRGATEGPVWSLQTLTRTGDITGDGKVNVFDLQRLGASWNKQLGDEGYDSACDLNGDARVNVFDLHILGANWGT